MNKNTLDKATFAGGCFWCMQWPFDRLDGVQKTTVGYIGGHTANPTYEHVCSGATGHTEAVEVIYDPNIVTYQQLLDVFWQNINPTTKNGQFADMGTQYRTEIFYHNDQQKRFAEESKKKLENSKKFEKPIATEITAASAFYPAEDYHQEYYQKDPMHYKMYSVGSGREDFLKKTWGNKN